jgi:uncharacterized protein (DUF2141 family)
MNQNFRGWAVWLIFITLIYSSSFFYGCANIVPPSGGPRDTVPPTLIGVNPPDSSLHFKSKKVTFYFDEYIELDNVIEKLIVSPTLKRTPTVTAKLRTLTMEIKDTLQPNTTYTFNFADAVRDVNERNFIEDFQYVVSTGDYLDSLQITGRLIMAETGIPDSNVAVMLYRNTYDSVVAKEKPVYYAKTKGDGSYRFKNLAPGQYKLFALKEEDRDLQYNQPTELIAFADSLVHLQGKNLHDVNLLLFMEKDSTIKAPVDSTLLAEEEEAVPEDKKKKLPKLQMTAMLEQGQQELQQPLTLSFNLPLKGLDSTQISLTEDTTRTPVAFYTRLDSTRTRLLLQYDWKQGKPYQLIMPKTAPTDTAGQQLVKADTISFKSKSMSDYGAVRVELTLSDSLKTAMNGDTSMHFVVQLVKDKNIKYSGRVINGLWQKNLLQPGEYEVRILLDANGNGVWDRGEYYRSPKKQPERVVNYPKKENIKANWLVTVKLQI